MLESRHDNPAAGHPGQFRTTELISRHYYWSGLKQAVTKYVQACDSCIRSKHSNQAKMGLLQPIDLPYKPWEEITYDSLWALRIEAMGQAVSAFRDSVPSLDKQSREGVLPQLFS